MVDKTFTFKFEHMKKYSKMEQRSMPMSHICVLFMLINNYVNIR